MKQKAVSNYSEANALAPLGGMADIQKELMQLWADAQYQACVEKSLKMLSEYPKSTVGWKILGSSYQQLGQAQEALNAFTQVSKLTPKDPEILFNLGNIHAQLSQYPSAINCFQHAIKLAPKFSQAYCNLGSVCRLAGNLKMAEKMLIKAVTLNQQDTQSLFELAVLLHEQKRPKEAMQYYRAAEKNDPDNALFLFNMAQAFEDIGDHDQAVSYYSRAIQLKPNYEDALYNLALHHKKHENIEQSEHFYLQVLNFNPQHEQALEGISSLYKELGRIRDYKTYFLKLIALKGNAENLNNYVATLLNHNLFHEAEGFCLQALALNDADPNIYCNLALISHFKNQFDKACEYYEKSLQLNPDSELTLNNYSLTLKTLGNTSKAKVCLDKALALNPNSTRTRLNLGNVYLDTGDVKQAFELVRHVAELEPANRLALQNTLFYDSYANSLGQTAHVACARKYGKLVTSVAQPFTSWNVHPEDQVLRIGLMSGDLRSHPVGYFLKSWLKHCNTSNIEIFAYSTGSKGDAYTGELKSYCTQWQELAGYNDAEAAKLIHDDGIHILIDLSGHTAATRLPVMAYKAAPIQAEWLGYWATTGVPAIDYFIADPIGVPVEHQQNFSETIAYLPHTRLCFTPPSNAPEVNLLPAFTKGYLTLGSFHKYTKVSDEVMALWGEVIKQTPDSKLYWQCRDFNDEQVKSKALTRLQQVGIKASDCILKGSVEKAKYLEAHHQVDFILDTFPFTGGTTTCDALWMGVPTLTLLGDTLIGRQGASLLSAAGLSDWIATSQESFIEKALFFASDIDFLKKLRAGLREQVAQSPLFDGELFAKDMSVLLFNFWHRLNEQSDTKYLTANAPLKDKATIYKHAIEKPSFASNQIRNDMSNITVETKQTGLKGTVEEIYKIAYSHQQTGDIDEAAKLYQEILQTNPKHADANHNLGFIQAHTTSIEAALPRFEIAVMARPESEQFWVSYIDALIAMSAIDTALQAIEFGQKCGLSAPMAQQLINDCQEKRAGTINIHDSSQNISTNNQQELSKIVDELYTSALVLERDGKLEEASELYEEIIKASPNHAPSNHSLGFIQAHKLSIEDALPRFKAAVQSNPHNEQYWVSYIDALILMLDRKSAVAAIKESKEYGLNRNTLEQLLLSLLRLGNAK